MLTYVYIYLCPKKHKNNKLDIQGVPKTFGQTSPDDSLNKDEQHLFQRKPRISYHFRDNRL